MHLAHLIDLAAARYPEAEAIIDGDRRLTYYAWQTGIRRVAGILAATLCTRTKTEIFSPLVGWMI